MKNNFKIRPSDVIPPSRPEIILPKYKIIIVGEKELVDVLIKEDVNGYEPVKWIEDINPNSQSDFKGWKILMGRK